MSGEEWKDVPGFDGRYQVSDLGRVRSVDRPVRCTSCRGEEVRIARGRVLRPCSVPTGHLRVPLGRGALRSVHALVAEAFIGPRPPGCDVAHLDGNPRNNVPSNLGYATRTENNRHVALHGRRHFTVEQIQYMRRLAGERGATTELRAALAAEFGTNKRHIAKILRGESYGYV